MLSITVMYNLHIKNISYIFYKTKHHDCLQDKRYDPNNLDDFMTEADTLGRLQIQQDIEEKRRL